MLDNEWLATYAPIGIYDQQKSLWKVLGAGVFVYDAPYTWYITAHHLISPKSDHFHVLVNHSKTKHYLIDLVSLHKKHRIEWIMDEDNDLAATLFPADPDFIIKAVGLDLFINSSNIVPSMACYTIGCPYGLPGFNLEKVIPFVQSGIVSSVTEQNGRIYVTAPTFPGNSGGPLLISRSPIKPNGDLVVGPPTIYLGGIVSKYVLVGGDESIGSLGLPPFHLGEVIPSETIKNLLNTKQTQSMKDKIGLS